MSHPSAHKIYELSVLGEQRLKLAVVVTAVRNNAGRKTFSWQEDIIRRDVENNPKRLPGRESCEYTVATSLGEIKSGAVLAIDQSISPCK